MGCFRGPVSFKCSLDVCSNIYRIPIAPFKYIFYTRIMPLKLWLNTSAGKLLHLNRTPTRELNLGFTNLITVLIWQPGFCSYLIVRVVTWDLGGAPPSTEEELYQKTDSMSDHEEQEIPRQFTTKISLKITRAEFALNFPGANELMIYVILWWYTWWSTDCHHLPSSSKSLLQIESMTQHFTYATHPLTHCPWEI